MPSADVIAGGGGGAPTNLEEERALQTLVGLTGLSAEFLTYYFAKDYGSPYGWGSSPKQALNSFTQGGKRVTELDPEDAEKLKGFFGDQYKKLSPEFQTWLKARATAGPTTGESAEAYTYTQGGIQQQSREATSIMDFPAGIDPWGHIYNLITESTVVPSAGAEEKQAQAQAQAGPGGTLIGSVSDVFAPLTPEQLGDLGVGEISEKFGLQRLAIEDPEGFLQAMFDKSGVVASPPVYGFLRDLMPSITLLASTKQGQDIINSPGGAVQLNQAINEVISQGYPSAGSILEGLSKLGGLARPFLGEGQFDTQRQEFRFVAATLNDLIGPTMSQPLRQALFNTKSIETQGDRFLSASARGMYKGSFIDWLKEQGYPLPSLPAYTPATGATAEAGGAATGSAFVESATGGIGATPTGTPAFQVKGGIYPSE